MLVIDTKLVMAPIGGKENKYHVKPPVLPSGKAAINRFVKEAETLLEIQDRILNHFRRSVKIPSTGDSPKSFMEDITEDEIQQSIEQVRAELASLDAESSQSDNSNEADARSVASQDEQPDLPKDESSEASSSDEMSIMEKAGKRVRQLITQQMEKFKHVHLGRQPDHFVSRGESLGDFAMKHEKGLQKLSLKLEIFRRESRQILDELLDLPCPDTEIQSLRIDSFLKMEEEIQHTLWLPKKLATAAKSLSIMAVPVVERSSELLDRLNQEFPTEGDKLGELCIEWMKQMQNS